MQTSKPWGKYVILGYFDAFYSNNIATLVLGRHCCLLLLSVVKRANIWLYLPHALMDFNQSWVIDATWEPSFVDEVKGHISRSKVI